MNLQARNRRIREEYKKDVSIRELALKNSLSQERVRQIIRAKDINDFYRDIEEKYKITLSEADYQWLKEEIAYLSENNRNKELVIRRRVLVRYLHDKLGYPFYRIGQILNRHHTTIMNSYYDKQ
jgi:chromosomal replication initiation ATPase DnaA